MMRDDGVQAIDLRPVEIDPDGWVVDDQGEILGRPDEGVFVDLPPDPETGEARRGWQPIPERCWRIQTDADAEAVLDRLGREEAAAEAVATRKRAMLERFERLEGVHRRRAEWIRRQYAAQLADLARARLAGAKRKSYVLANGTIAFRKSAGTARIVDMSKAVEWARFSRPELIRTKEDVLSSETRKAVEEDVALGLLDFVPSWIEITPPGESVRIETIGVSTALDRLGESSEWPAEGKRVKGGAA